MYRPDGPLGSYADLPTFSLKSASTAAVPSFSLTVIFHFDDMGSGRDNNVTMYAYVKGENNLELHKKTIDMWCTQSYF